MISRPQKVILVALFIFVVVTAFVNIPTLRTSAPGHIIRFCLGEAGATQNVNDAADKIISSGWEKDLIVLADTLTSEFGPVRDKLPEAFMGGRSIPIERLPAQYRQLGGMYVRIPPELVLRSSAEGVPAHVVIDWAHMRHAIIVFSTPPSRPPQGFFVRKVNARVYVVANES